MKIEKGLVCNCSEMVIWLGEDVKDIVKELETIVNITGWQLGHECWDVFHDNNLTPEKLIHRSIFVPLTTRKNIKLKTNKDISAFEKLISPSKDFDLSVLNIYKIKKMPTELDICLYNPETGAYLDFITESYGDTGFGFKAESDCVQRDFIAIKKISEHYKTEPRAYDGGTTQNYEEWVDLMNVKDFKKNGGIVEVKVDLNKETLTINGKSFKKLYNSFYDWLIENLR